MRPMPLQSSHGKATWRITLPRPWQSRHLNASAKLSNVGFGTARLHPRALHSVLPLALHFGQSTLLYRPAPLQPTQAFTPLKVFSLPDPPHLVHSRLTFVFPLQALQLTLWVPPQRLHGASSRIDLASAMKWSRGAPEAPEAADSRYAAAFW